MHTHLNATDTCIICDTELTEKDNGILHCPKCENEQSSYCPSCSGSGEGMYDGSRCSSCNGIGEI